MIEPMKKYSFLVYHKEYIDFLKGIQNLGVLHVIEKESGEIEDEETRVRYQHINELTHAIKFLSNREVTSKPNKKETDGLVILSELKKLQEDQESNQQRLTQYKKEKLLLEPWGNFNWESIEKLKEAGYKTNFYICPSRNFNPEWEETYTISRINELSGQVYFVIIEKTDTPVEIDAENIRLPETSLLQLNKSIKETDGILEKTEDLFNDFASQYLKLLIDTKEKLSAELKFDRVVLSAQKEAEDKLMFLEGWVPDEKEKEIKDFLDEQGIYYLSSKPVPTENVPIKLKNNKFSKLFEPIGELYTMPDYKELDLTPFFAPFFMMFFGFCLGDAGYGLLILIAAIILSFKVKPPMRSIITLGIFLGAATVFMGIVGGTFFGINLIDSGYTITAKTLETLKISGVPHHIINQLSVLANTHIDKQASFLSQVKSVIGEPALKMYRSQILHFVESDYPILNSIRFLMLNTDQLMLLSFAVGFVQTIFGMGIKAANKAKQFGFVHALSIIGWIVVILGGVILYGLKRFDVITPSQFKFSFIIIAVIGGFFIFFLNSPGKNPFLNFGLGIWDTYGTASGLLGDLLSYVRLFALGISSAVLGNVFNQLAFSLSPDIIVVGQLVTLLILLFGHSLNLFMSALGSFVHPLRLTFVEFYKNAGFAGGGRKYDPFRNAINTQYSE